VALPRYLPRWIAVAWMVATPAFAADQPVQPWLSPLATKTAPVPDLDYFVPQPVPAFQGEFGARFWYASEKTGKSLYDPAPSDAMISRLTYSGMTTAAGELFGRLTFTNGIFLKGYAGVGGLLGGNLRDEDFPPGINPYSSTNSNQHNGELAYASADLGYDVLRGGDFRVGAFAGYHYFNEAINAYGCTQTVTNPVVCQPPVPNSIEVISQHNYWQSLRLGLDGSVLIGQRFKLTGEAVWLPYVFLNGADTHWLRIGSAVGDFTGPIPEDGRGQGYQFEALLSYQVTEYGSVGIGARYWHMQTNGSDHESFVGGGAVSPPVEWKADVYGVFVQGSLKLGPYPVSLH
jgi:outer membrane protease